MVKEKDLITFLALYKKAESTNDSYDRRAVLNFGIERNIPTRIIRNPYLYKR
jgi:hypothetical protein